MKFGYTDKKTPIHRLHPGCKILWVLGILIGGILISDPIFLILLFLSTITFVIIGKITKEWFTFIKFALWLMFFIIIINTLVSQHGSHILFNLPNFPVVGVLTITLESLVFGFTMSIRLLTMISAFAIVTLTVNPDDLLQTILKLRFPYRTVLTTTIAIRFIPCLFADIDTLQDSLRTRGYKMDDRHFLNRIKRRAKVILPLLSNSLERSIQSAESMESRGFGLKGKKTYYKTIATSRVDIMFILLSLSLFFVFIFMWIQNVGTYSFYPSLTPISVTFSYISTVIFVMFIVASPAVFSPVKKVIDLD